MSLAFFYQNASLPVDVATDRFVFEELTDNHSLVNANLVVWDPECYEFLRHVLERRPPRLLDLLARGFEVEKIVVLPDTALLAAPDQKVMSFKFVGPTSGQLLRVRALRTGPATFGPLTFE